MSPPRDVIFDLTRLATRFSRPTPNGIDRVDLGYAQHFLSESRGGRGALLGPAGLRALDNPAGRSIVDAISGHWREAGRVEDDEVYSRLVAHLSADPTHRLNTRVRRPSTAKAGRSIARLLAHGNVLGWSGLYPARNLARTVPQGAVYLNVSQFPLWLDWYFRWLDRRPDVKAVFFIHDLLPITYPEFFPPAEARRHDGRLRVLARRSAGVIMASDYTRGALEQHLRSRGERVPPICVLPLPVASPFGERSMAPPLRTRRDYFVSVGTIEPRKNQLLLLNVWRELAARFGDRTPSLLLVGARGWENENVIDMLERCRTIQPYVVEVAGLSTPALRHVMAGARAFLMPTLAEGYGLPVAEADAVGVPLIVSDALGLDVRMSRRARVLDPTDGPGWRDAIAGKLLGEGPSEPVLPPSGDQAATDWAWHIEHVEKFLRIL
jgi:glycosyltransferase involved in cell wall biosynthesis